MLKNNHLQIPLRALAAILTKIKCNCKMEEGGKRVPNPPQTIPFHQK